MGFDIQDFNGKKTLVKYLPPPKKNEIEAEIPYGIEIIGKFAFWSCKQLEIIKIPDTVTAIEDNAFSYCESLKEIVIPDSVKEIGEFVFYRCKSLTVLNIPESIHIIHKDTFRKCDNLSIVRLPKGLQIIEECAFYECNIITDLYLPYNVIIHRDAFGCNLRTIPYYIFHVFYNEKNYCLKYNTRRFDEAVWVKIQTLISEADKIAKIRNLQAQKQDSEDVVPEIPIVLKHSDKTVAKKEPRIMPGRIVHSQKKWFVLTTSDIVQENFLSNSEIVSDTNHAEQSNAHEQTTATDSAPGNDKNGYLRLITLKNTVAAYKGDKPFIFISYAHKNADTILPLLTELKNRGYRFWYDEGIEPGTAWRRNIADKVATCGMFVAFISNDYVSSKYCTEELYFAEKKERELQLIHISQTDMPNDLDMAFSVKQQIMLYELPEPRGELLADAIESLPQFAQFRE